MRDGAMVMDVMAPGGLSHTATGGGWASRRSKRRNRQGNRPVLECQA